MAATAAGLGVVTSMPLGVGNGTGAGMNIQQAATLAFQQDATARAMPQILCCNCGVKIESNPANMCANCLKSQIDITQGISKQVAIPFCRGCGRYQKPPWMAVELESREMLALCLSRIRGLNKDVKLIDAGFIWTEPHSRRIKVKLKVEKEILAGAIVQQTFVVDFVVTNQQCLDCQKSYTENTWTACVQVRQKVEHKRSMMYLEQLLLKHKMTERCLQVKEQPDGLDFYFNTKSDANKLIAFLQSVVPIKTKTARRLISEDDKNNLKKYKFTLYVELSPVSKDDLVCLEPRLAQQLGGVSPIMLCFRVTQNLHFIDPLTQRLVDCSAGTYWHHPFPALMHAKQMIEYVVIAIDRASADEEEVSIPVPVPNTTGAGLSKEDVDDDDMGDSTTRSLRSAHSNVASAGSSLHPSGPPSVAGSVAASGSHASAAQFAATASFGSASARAAAATARGSVPAPVKSTVNPALANTMFADLHSADQQKYNNKHHAKFTAKLCLARCVVAKVADLGVNDTQYECVTHLGHILKAGDTVLGYHVDSAVVSDALLYASDTRSAVKTSKSKKKKQSVGKKDLQLPEVILVRKSYKNREKFRNWKLKTMPKVALTNADAKAAAGDADDRHEQDREWLHQDIEMDPSMRQNIAIYKKDKGLMRRAGDDDDALARPAPRKGGAAGMEDDGAPASAAAGAGAAAVGGAKKPKGAKAKKAAAQRAADAVAASMSADADAEDEAEARAGATLPEDELIDDLAAFSINSAAPPTPPNPFGATSAASAVAASHLPALAALPKAASPTGVPPQQRGPTPQQLQQQQLAAMQAQEQAMKGMTPQQRMEFAKAMAQRGAEQRAAAAFGGPAAAPLAMSQAAAAAAGAMNPNAQAAARSGVQTLPVSAQTQAQQQAAQQAMLAAFAKQMTGR